MYNNEPKVSPSTLTQIQKWRKKNWSALAGHRTQATRVAGENSTTEPPVLGYINRQSVLIISETFIQF